MSESARNKRKLSPENEEQLKQRNAKKDELYHSNFEAYLILAGIFLSDLATALEVEHPKPRQCKTPK